MEASNASLDTNMPERKMTNTSNTNTNTDGNSNTEASNLSQGENTNHSAHKDTIADRQLLSRETTVTTDGGASTKPRSGILRTAESRDSPDSRVNFSVDEVSSRKDATDRARSFINTPEKKPVNVHQYYTTLENDYKIQPGIVFFDEDTEEEDEGQEGEGQTDGELNPPLHISGVTDERPESVLTDVTVDGLADQDITDMPGLQIVTKPKPVVMSLSTVEEKQTSLEEDTTMTDEAVDEDVHRDDGGRPATQGTIGLDDVIPDSIFSTAVDEYTLDAARERVQDSQGEGQNELARLITDKLRHLYNKGLRCKSQGDYDTAIRAFTKVIILKPESVLPYVQRAECYLMTADFKSAIVNYKKACLLEPNSEIYYNRLAFIYYLQGQTYFDAQMYTEALELFAQTAEIKPDNDSYHTRSIVCLAALQRHGECLALVDRRLAEETNNTDLYVMRSRLHLMFKNISLCYYDLKDALSLDPEHKEANQILSHFKKEADNCHTSAVQLAIQGRDRDALQKITSAIEYDPTQAKYHNIRGALNRQLKDFNAAVDDYLLALDKTNQDETSEIYQDAQHQLLLTYNDFAIECFKKGFYQEAIMLLNKAIKGEKREKGLYVNRGDCFFRCNDFQFALADYHQALELDPSDDSIRVRISIIHNEYGTIEYQSKSYGEAESRFTLAIRNDPRISHYYVSRARARYMLEQHGAARTDILTAMHINPNQENIISLTSRLFPGKTIDEIMSSKPAMAIKNSLHHVISTSANKKLAPLHSKAKMNKLERKVQIEYRACVEEEDFNRWLTKDKQIVHNKVKSALRNRKSLRNTAPALAPRAPVNDVQTGVQTTGWRTFTRGISVRDATP